MVEKQVLGKYEEVRDGVPLKYRIETATPEIADEIVEHMIKYFLAREPLTAYDGLRKEEDSLKSFIGLWKDAINAGAALVAIEDRDDDKLNIVGANITLVYEKDKKEEDKTFEGKAFNKCLKAVDIITKRGNLYERYGVDKYLSAFGLSVHPDYHGYKIGYRLLQCREPLCKALGLKATGTVFSSAAAQHLAAKAGFEILAEEGYDTYEVDGEVGYAGMAGKLTHMGRMYNF
ncbi:hypothetical protein O3M35_001051 [Rhynocoris fuscipes]|uniref:N-acetyltransferase domain-containing protein n=1 Tax=Rhynocoris fuscipes TaxID=488301 RepID=A0AAW1DPW7_9HEMI